MAPPRRRSRQWSQHENVCQQSRRPVLLVRRLRKLGRVLNPEARDRLWFVRWFRRESTIVIRFSHSVLACLPDLRIAPLFASWTLQRTWSHHWNWATVVTSMLRSLHWTPTSQRVIHRDDIWPMWWLRCWRSSAVKTYDQPVVGSTSSCCPGRGGTQETSQRGTIFQPRSLLIQTENRAIHFFLQILLTYTLVRLLVIDFLSGHLHALSSLITVNRFRSQRFINLNWRWQRQAWISIG